MRGLTPSLLILTLAISISPSADAQATFKVVERAARDGQFLRVTYMASEKVSEADLGQFLKTTGFGSSPNYREETAFFLLPGMAGNDGCWASANLKTGKIELLGTTLEEEKELMRRPIKADTILGRWIDDKAVGRLIAIYSRDGKAYVGFLFPGAKAITERELSRLEPKTEMRLKLVDGDDVYHIDKDGNLEIRDTIGVVSAIPKPAVPSVR